MQTGSKKSVRPRFCVCACPLGGFDNHLLVVLLSGPLEKDVGPGVNEESKPGSIGSLCVANS